MAETSAGWCRVCELAVVPLCLKRDSTETATRNLLDWRGVMSWDTGRGRRGLCMWRAGKFLNMEEETVIPWIILWVNLRENMSKVWKCAINLITKLRRKIYDGVTREGGDEYWSRQTLFMDWYRTKYHNTPQQPAIAGDMKCGVQQASKSKDRVVSHLTWMT